jgi:hypothetical protein
MNPFRWPLAAKLATVAVIVAGIGGGAALAVPGDHASPHTADTIVAGPSVSVTAPASAVPVTPAAGPGLATYICRGRSNDSLLQWTETNGHLSGTYSYSEIIGHAPQEQVTSNNGDLDGTLNGGDAVSITLGSLQPMDGTLSGGALTLDVPHSDRSFQPGSCGASSMSDWNRTVSSLESAVAGDNGTALREQASAAQASASAAASQAAADQAAEQQLRGDLSQLRSWSLSGDLSALSTDVQAAGTDLGTLKTDAANGPGNYCGNADTVDGEADTVDGDADSLIGGLDTLTYDISTGKQYITTVQNDLATLQSDGLAMPSGASAAVSSAQSEISQAVSTANRDIATVNGDVSTAYTVANDLAGTASCRGPGSPPSPIADISA